MPDKLFNIYRSSAGSGKTYRLVLDYLVLVLRYPDYYKRILAVTFTNKATNEMKGRIISSLNDIACNHSRASDLKTSLCSILGINEVLLQERAGNTLRSILHGYNYFSVSTIDSFFQKVVSSFARELGIQGGYNLEFDMEKVVDAIVDQLFLDIDDNKTLLKWMIQFSESRIDENKSWDVRYEIKRLAGKIFSENVSHVIHGLEEISRDTDLLQRNLHDIQKEINRYDQHLTELGRRGEEALMDFGLQESDFLNGSRGGPGTLFSRLSDPNGFTPTKSQVNAYHDRDKFFAKSSEKKDLIIAALDNGLQDLYTSALDFYHTNLVRINTYREILRLFYHLGIFTHLLKNVRDYRKANDVILISDLAELLGEIIGENDTPFIYEKTGSFLQHFLIDEFQDTSERQWNNFKPLVQNAVAQNKVNLIVGDVKQSIYRWRGGNWRILQQKVTDDIGAAYCQVTPLDINWRSSKNIVHFNNMVFSVFPEYLSNLFRDSLSGNSMPVSDQIMETLTGRFQNAYADVIQKLPSRKHDKDEGFVRVEFLDDQPADDGVLKWQKQVPEKVFDTIIELQDRGAQAKDIAILVRSKYDGRKVANHLLERKRGLPPGSPYQLDIISSESLFLSGSPSINFVIHLMKIILNEQDEVAWTNVVFWQQYLQYGHLQDFESKLESLTKEGDRTDWVGLSSEKMIQYRTLPVNDLLEVLIRDYELELLQGEKTFLTALRNAALDYGMDHNNDLFSFLEWWEEDGKTRSIKPSEEQNAIRIQTIHQSKGLEFKYVIIPYCSWELDHKANKEILWCRTEDKSLSQIPYYPVKYSKKLAETYFASQYCDEMSMAFLDSLNLLYVAQTRAESGLFIFAPSLKPKGSVNNVGLALHQLCCLLIENGLDSPDPENCLTLRHHWDGSSNTIEIGHLDNIEKPDVSPENYLPGELDRSDWRKRITIRQQADILLKDDTVRPFEKVNYGILIHEILSKIIYRQDADNILKREMMAGNLTEEHVEEVKQFLENIWKSEEIADWFSDRWTIKTEVPVLPESGQLSRLDRVMISGNMVVLVDYKTGQPKSRDHDQVVVYMDILRHMGYLETEGYLLYIPGGQLVKVKA